MPKPSRSHKWFLPIHPPRYNSPAYVKEVKPVKTSVPIDYSLVKVEERKRMVRQTKYNRRRPVVSTITWKDVPYVTHCPLLGIELFWGLNIRGEVPSHAATIDRIDSTKGYVPGNIQVLSFLANRMKNNATKEQLITFAENVLLVYR